MIDPLRSLTYFSTPTRSFDADALHALGADAARSNALEGISGLLVFNGRRFCQTIEGGAVAVDYLLERLRRDPRHQDIVIASDAVIDERRFGTWRMRALFLTSDNSDSIEPYVRTHLEAVDPHRGFWAA